MFKVPSSTRSAAFSVPFSSPQDVAGAWAPSSPTTQGLWEAPSGTAEKPFDPMWVPVPSAYHLPSTCPLSLQLPLWAGLSKAGDGVIPKNGSEDSGSFFGVRVAQDSAALRFPVDT